MLPKKLEEIVGGLIILTGLLLLFTSCANVSSTRFIYTDPSGSSVTIEMPKEVEATDLKVFINALEGTASIEAKEWTSKNIGTIEAQGGREAILLEGVSKGVVEGAMKGINPIP